MSIDSTDLALTVAQFCATAKISRTTFDLLRKEGRAPPSVKVGRKRLIRREAAEAWLKELEQA